MMAHLHTIPQLSLTVEQLSMGSYTMVTKKCKNCNQLIEVSAKNPNQHYCEMCQYPEAADGQYRDYWYHAILLTKEELRVLLCCKQHQFTYDTLIERSKLKQQMKIIDEAYKRKVAYENPKEAEK